MIKKQSEFSDPAQQAIEELKGLIRQRFPTASFGIRRGVDDPEQVFIIATVDTADPDDVMDTVIDRLLELKFDRGIPINVVPVHTQARIAATKREISARHGPPQTPALSSLPRA